MSRLRLPNGQGWQDQGPSGCRSDKKGMGGSLVVGGKSNAPVMGIWKNGLGLNATELREARRIYIGHVGKNR